MTAQQNKTKALIRGPITLGRSNIILDDPVFLAPMSGITDAPFRKWASKLGAGLVVSEMVASENLAKTNARELRKTSGGEARGLRVIQLAGREAHWMAEGAKVARDLGADIIDINMGCPAKQVTNGASGSALMRDLDHALTLIDAIVEAVDIPVSLKMRLGWDDKETAPKLARRAEEAGVQMIIVHGRTRQQFYKGQADWHAIGRVKQVVKIPVIANGDVTSSKRAFEILRQSGADGIMIGRGAYGAPWFPGQVADDFAGRPVKQISLEQQWQIASGHYQDMLSHYGTQLGVRCARKHLAWYLESATGRTKDDPLIRHWRKILCTQENPKTVLDQLKNFYADCVQGVAA